MKNKKIWISIIIILVIIFPIGIAMLVWYFLFYKKGENNGQNKPIENKPDVVEKDRENYFEVEIKIDVNQSMKPITYAANGNGVKLAIQAVASNQSQLTYQWFKTLNNATDEFTKVINQTYNYLQLSNDEVIKNNEVIYKCRVTNVQNKKFFDVVSKIQIVNPIIEVVQKPKNNKILKIFDSFDAEFLCQIQNQNFNTNWKLKYQWVKRKNGIWTPLVSDKTIQVQDNKLRFINLNHEYFKYEYGCIVNVENTIDFNRNEPHQDSIFKLNQQEPKIESLKIVSNDLSASNWTKLNSTPLLNLETKLNDYSELPEGYSYKFNWYESNDGVWQIRSQNNSYQLEKQTKPYHKIKVKVEVEILKDDKSIDKKEDEIQIKTNPKVVALNLVNQINILKNHPVKIKTDLNIEEQNNSRVLYEWYFNSYQINKSNSRYLNQETKELTIPNTLKSDQGKYQLIPIVNGVKYQHLIKPIELNVFNNPPKISGISYEKNKKILLNHNDFFRIKIEGEPKVNYVINNARFRYLWTLQNSHGEFEVLEEGSNFSGTKSIELTVKNIKEEKKIYVFKFQIEYYDSTRSIKNRYSFLQSEPITIEVTKLKK